MVFFRLLLRTYISLLLLYHHRIDSLLTVVLRWSVAGSLLYFTAKGCLSIAVIRFYYHIFPTNCLLISIFYASFGSIGFLGVPSYNMVNEIRSPVKGSVVVINMV